jgi:hypothetical protein
MYTMAERLAFGPHESSSAFCRAAVSSALPSPFAPQCFFTSITHGSSGNTTPSAASANVGTSRQANSANGRGMAEAPGE